MITLAGLLAVAAPALGAPLQDPDPLAFKLTATLALGPPGQWDSLAYDDDTQRLFIAHGTQVTVVSTSNPLSAHPHADSMTIVGKIAGLDDAHGIVLVPGGRGYAASGKTGSVIAFDLDTLKPKTAIRTGAGPAALAFDPQSHNVFAVNAASGTITVISTQSNSVIATITAGGTLTGAAADGQGNLFVNQSDTGSLLRVDTARNTVTGRWKLAGCEGPAGMALDEWSHHIFISCANATLVVVNGGSGIVLAHIPIGAGAGSVAYDADRHLVFSASGDGTLAALSTVSFLPLVPAPTAPGARTMALDPVGGRIFMVTPDTAAPGALKLLVYSPAS